MRDRARDRNALRLAARKLHRARVRTVLEVHRAKEIARALPCLAGAHPARAQPERDVLDRGHGVEEHAVLEDDAGGPVARGNVRRVVVEHCPVERDGPALDRRKPREDPYQSGLACAVRADERDRAAPFGFDRGFDHEVGGDATDIRSQAHRARNLPRSAYAAELVGINLFTGRLEPIGDGAARLQTDAGAIVVSCPAALDSPLEDVTALLRPVDVVLFREQPSQASARNAIRGTIRSIADDGQRARIRIDASPPLIADVTSGSVSRLGLKEGGPVWASFKAVEVRLVLPS